MVTGPDDPIVEKITAKWQLTGAKQALAEGKWRIMVAVEGRRAGGAHLGGAGLRASNVRRGAARAARHDEAFMFDLFVEREYRRSNIGMTMAALLLLALRPGRHTRIKYVYGFISYENAPSILWHFSVGFNIVQTINYLAIGPRIKWKIPFSDNPRFGPMSNKGRYNDPEKELFGTSLMPNV